MKTPAKLGLLTSLYLSQGLPFGFFTQALPVLLRKQGVSLPNIGLAHLLALPWALKFLWAPLLDRHASKTLGHWRGYILPLQLLSAGVVALVAAVDPAHSMPVLLAVVLLTNLLAATQDIATDALAVDLLSEEERGLGNGVQVAGYRVGMILGGGLLLIVFEELGWANTFLAMALTLLVATVPIALFQEPEKLKGVAGESRSTRPLMAALADWSSRPGARAWLLVLLVYKTGDALGIGMLRTFLVDTGLTLKEIGEILGVVGFTTGLLGALAGGQLVNRLGRRRALILFGTLQAISVGLFGWAALGVSRQVLYGLCALEHFTGGMATAALFTAMMDVCRPEEAATDYTVQACVVVFATGLASTLSGYSAQALGFPLHFAVSSLLGFLGMAYVALYRERSEQFALLVHTPKLEVT